MMRALALLGGLAAFGIGAASAQDLARGEKIAGHIMLTYHQDECWFRNLKIREIQ